jgi:nitrite reductase/ring-hydroxylating ferredoxin subunit
MLRTRDALVAGVRCPEGTFENGIVAHPWYFRQFDPRTGDVTVSPPADPLRRYEVRVEC